MNNRIGIIILLLLCLGLGVAIMTVKKHASDQHQKDTAQIETASNQVVKVNADLDDQKKVNVTLEKDLDAKKKDYEKSLGDLTNNLTEVSANLEKTEANLRTAAKEIKERDTKISDLESQNQALDKKAETLSGEISKLTAQIDDTKHKLAASEGDKALLQKELQRLIADKTELERQFSDLTVLRAQVAKLKADAAIARRLEWSRQGILASAEEKGAQRLMQGLAAVQPKPARPNYDLNVEVSADGSLRVVPPLTNNPSINPASR